MQTWYRKGYALQLALMKFNQETLIVLLQLAFLGNFCPPPAEVQGCWRAKDLAKNSHNLQTGCFQSFKGSVLDKLSCNETK